jgi:membrane fusion protein, multidrug efflux system
LVFIPIRLYNVVENKKITQMKLRHIVISVVIIVLLGAIYVRINLTEKKEKKITPISSIVYLPVVKTENKTRSFSLESYGQIISNQKLDLAFEVSGKLMNNAVYLKPGIQFKRGDILASIDNGEAIYTLSARKSNFLTLIANAMPDVRLDFELEVEKWNAFLHKISIDTYLPTLPKMNSKREELFFTTRNIISEYNSIRSQELRMEKYFFIAPFDGTVLEVFAEPGAIVNPGTRVATIVKTGDYELKIPIMLKDLPYFEEKGVVDVKTSSGELIGKGVLSRVSNIINQNTQSIDAFFSVEAYSGKRIMNGMFVNVVLNKESFGEVMSLPILAVQNGHVNVIRDSAVVSVPVQVVASIPDTLLVLGLSNGMEVITDQILGYADSLKIVGIKKM